MSQPVFSLGENDFKVSEAGRKFFLVNSHTHVLILTSRHTGARVAGQTTRSWQKH